MTEEFAADDFDPENARMEAQWCDAHSVYLCDVCEGVIEGEDCEAQDSGRKDVTEELDAVDDDIVRRLRDLAAWAPDDEPDEGFALAAEAADVIERLRAENERLRAEFRARAVDAVGALGMERVGVATEAGIASGSDFVVTPRESPGDVPLYRLFSTPLSGGPDQEETPDGR